VLKWWHAFRDPGPALNLFRYYGAPRLSLKSMAGVFQVNESIRSGVNSSPSGADHGHGGVGGRGK
jgi:hypothetical protein